MANPPSFGMQLGQTAASQSSTGLISGLLGQLFGGMNARRDWKYQQKAMALQQRYALEQMAKSAEYQLTHDKEMFDYQNAYNEPTKVFERYAQAGINPAAVLGSSGVGVSATVPTSPGSAPSASGPTGAGSPRSAFNVPSDPLALANLEVTEANADRANAAADLDRANADKVRNETISKELYEALVRSEKALNDAGVTDKNEQARLKGALADIYAADAVYADLMATYKFQDYVAQYAKDIEEYNQIKRFNDEYLDSIFSTRVILDLARAWESFNSGSTLAVESEIANVRLNDLRNWFDVNWNTKIPVPIVNEKGKPTGDHKMLTGKEIHSYLLGLDVTHGNQQTAGTWFSNRSEKNALGYSMLKAVVQGAAGMAASYVGAKTLGAGISSSTSSSTSGGSTARSVERYDSKGNLVGYTIENMTSEGHTAGRSRSRRSR